MRIVEKTQLMSAAEIDRTLQRLAHQIVEKSGGTQHLALIGIRRRGVPLAQRIAQAMRGIDGVEVPVGTLDITLYRDDLSKVAPQAVLQSSDISFPVDSMDLVLVDDVLYTGRTIRAAMNGLFDLGRPKRVSLCVLIDRGHREMPIEAQSSAAISRPATPKSLRCVCAKLTTKSASSWWTAWNRSDDNVLLRRDAAARRMTFRKGRRFPRRSEARRVTHTECKCDLSFS